MGNGISTAEQLDALNEFKAAVVDEKFINRLADELFVENKFPSALPYLDGLISKFSNAGKMTDNNDRGLMYMNFIKRREGLLLARLADEIHHSR